VAAAAERLCRPKMAIVEGFGFILDVIDTEGQFRWPCISLQVSRLLKSGSQDEPEPAAGAAKRSAGVSPVVRPLAESAFFFLRDHAGRALPRSLNRLHYEVDSGAGDPLCGLGSGRVGGWPKGRSAQLDAFLILQQLLTAW